MARLAEISKQRAEAETKLEPVITLLGKVKEGVVTALKYGAMSSPLPDPGPLREFQGSLDTSVKRLEALLPIDECIATLESLPVVSAAALEAVAKTEAFIVVRSARLTACYLRTAWPWL